MKVYLLAVEFYDERKLYASFSSLERKKELRNYLRRMKESGAIASYKFGEGRI